MLSRDESRLIAAIENHLDQINEPSFLQLRPLHLSVEWSYGIETLLKYGADANVTDKKGFDPVDHAIARASSESLKLFENVNCALFTSEQLQTAIQLEKEASTCDLSIRASIVDIIINKEADRRRKLHSFVTHSLPECAFRSLSFREDRLLDEQASAARAALKRHNVSIPTFFLLGDNHGTVYHYSDLTERILDTFWEAGFRDVNGLDWKGRTPSQAIRFQYMELEKALRNLAWFENKGVDIYEKINHLCQNSRIHDDSDLNGVYQGSGHTILHYICYYNSWVKPGVNDVLHNVKLLFDFSKKGNKSQAYLRRIAGSKIQDACICACSYAGCQALHMIFKRHFRRWGQNVKQSIPRHLNNILSPVKLDGMISNEVFSEILRFWTFTALSLTHTCCRSNWYCSDNPPCLMSLETDEINEIHEEEQEDLQLLERLLVEFDHRREQFGHPLLREFINGYWQTRMEEVLSERKPMDYDKIREIGVVLHDSGSGSDPDFYVDAKTEDEDENEDEAEVKNEDQD